MPLVSFSVACLSCLSFFSPLCRLTAHSLPSSWLRHGWPFLFLLYTSCYKERRIKKGTRTLRTIQKQERRMVRIGRTSPLSQSWFYPFLSIHLSFSHTPPRTDIPTAYFENDWTRFVSRHVPVYPSPFSLCLLESCQFRRTAQMFSSFSHLYRSYTYILLLYLTFPCHPSFSLLVPTFSFDTGARATTLDASICSSICPPLSTIRNPRSFAFLSRRLLSFLSFHTTPFVRLYHIGRTWRICGKEGNNYHYE